MKKPQRKWIVFGLTVILGLMLILVFPGYDFSGLFCLGLAALIPVYHLIRNRKVLKRMLTVLLVIFFTAIAVTGVIIGRTSHGTLDPKSDYLIVLGAGVYGTTPSRTLRERLEAALGYLESHPNAVAVVSGGKGNGEDITEAQCMFNYLTASGIHPDRVWMEDQAVNTIQNLTYSLDLIEARTGICPGTAAVVSSEYHLFRANLFAQRLGLNAELVPAKTSYPLLRLNYFLREVFAVWYYSIIGG